MADDFYAPPLARVHDAGFTDLARAAARALIADLRRAGHHTGTVVDLGCGSGVLAGVLAEAGYDPLGIDLSPAMIELARRRVPAATFRQGSIWDVDLPPAVGVAAIGEVVNYAADPRTGLAQLDRLIGSVAAALTGGGRLLFDVATPGRAGPDRATMGFHDGPDHSLHVDARETTADDGAPLLERRMVLFTRDGEVYRRSDEVHQLRLYDAGRVQALLERAGLVVSARDGYDDHRLSPGWVAFAAHAPGRHMPA